MSFVLLYLPLYLAAISAISFAAFALDKAKARNRHRRIPERVLLWLAAVGGSPGALLAQHRLRHKTQKEPFRTHLNLIAGLHLAIAAGAMLAVFFLDIREFMPQR